MFIFNKVLDATKKVSVWISWISIISAVVVMALAVVDIFSTKLFGRPIPGVLEIIEQLMVLVIIIPLAYVVFEKGHIRIDILETYMGKTGRYILNIFQNMVVIMVMGFMTWRACAYLSYMITTKTETSTLYLPLWPANVAIVIAYGMLTIVFILLFCKTLLEGVHEQKKDGI